MRSKTLMLVMALALVALPAIQAAAGTADSERVIDVQKLTTVVKDASKPIQERMRSTKLKEKFEAVNKMLKEENVDKKQLVAALKELEQELDRFCNNWQEVVNPLWEGQEAVAGTIEKVRLMLARCKTGEPNAQTKKILENYDVRLRNLARAVKEEKNEDRQRQLKLMFANVLELRKLVQKYGSVDLGKAGEAVYAKTLRALVALESQFSAATFQVEKARVILAAESDFIKQYVGIMEGVIEAEELAKLLSDMKQAGHGLGGLTGDLGGMTKEVEQFQASMAGLMDKMATSIQNETDKIQADVAPLAADSAALDAEIERYSK